MLQSEISISDPQGLSTMEVAWAVANPEISGLSDNTCANPLMHSHVIDVASKFMPMEKMDKEKEKSGKSEHSDLPALLFSLFIILIVAAGIFLNLKS